MVDWDASTERFRRPEAPTTWRSLCDALHLALLERWLPREARGRLLKTDLFDEAAHEGLLPELASRGWRVHGVDIAPTVVVAAESTTPDLRAVVADVRHLPQGDHSVSVVVSNSTFDHFHDRADIDMAVAEAWRVLEPGGRLIITMDNPTNPIIRLRSVLPERLLRGSRLVPYFVGETLSASELRAVLERQGFAVTDTATVMHCPRVVVVPLSNLFDRWASPALQRRWVAWVLRAERASRWRTRLWTAHFVAALAVRSEAGMS